MTVIGICIPWFGSRTEPRRGSERKRQWEDHALYLDCLSEVLKGEQDRPLIIVGDFNQRIGQGGFVPPNLRSALQSAMPEYVTIATSALGHRGSRSIDREDLAAESLSVISNMLGERELSDHSGVGAVLTSRRAGDGWHAPTQPADYSPAAASASSRLRGRFNDRILPEVSREPGDPERTAGHDEERQGGHQGHLRCVWHDKVPARKGVLTAISSVRIEPYSHHPELGSDPACSTLPSLGLSELANTLLLEGF